MSLITFYDVLNFAKNSEVLAFTGAGFKHEFLHVALGLGVSVHHEAILALFEVYLECGSYGTNEESWTDLISKTSKKGMLISKHPVSQKARQFMASPTVETFIKSAVLKLSAMEITCYSGDTVQAWTYLKDESVQDEIHREWDHFVYDMR